MPIARGNRRRSITGKVILSSQASLDLAMALRGTFYDSLPPSGALVLTTGVQQLTYTNAVLESCTVLKDQKGVSVGFQFTFLPSGPAISRATNDITDDTGAPITDDTGSPITSS